MRSALFIIFSVNFLLSQASFAQIGLEGLKSGRYTVKKSGVKSAKPVARKIASETDPALATEGQVSASTESNSVTVVNPNFPSAQKQTGSPPSPNQTSVVTEEREPTFSQQFQSLTSEKNWNGVKEFYKRKIPNEDPRSNRIELFLSPTYLAIDSKSNSDFRAFSSELTAIEGGGTIWVTPRIGVYGKFLTSMNGDIKKVASTERVSAKLEDWTFGFNLRTFSNFSYLESSDISAKIIYKSTRWKPEVGLSDRPMITTEGFGVALTLNEHKTMLTSDEFGIEFYPRLTQTEGDVSSGSGASTSEIRLSYNWAYMLSRQSQVDLGLDLGFQKSHFDGSMDRVNPSTGTTLSGVGVNQTTTGLSLGYRWGK